MKASALAFLIDIYRIRRNRVIDATMFLRLAAMLFQPKLQIIVYVHSGFSQPKSKSLDEYR